MFRSCWSTRGSRVHHFYRYGATLCGITLGVGSGLVTDGDYGKKDSMCESCAKLAKEGKP